MSCLVADAPRAPLDLLAAQHEDWIVQQAITLLEQRLFKDRSPLDGPAAACEYLRLKLVSAPNEIFAAVFLDSRHQVLAFEQLFSGTVDGADVYPRVVLQRALVHNATSLILAHQHPSGCTTPSDADRRITLRLRDALAMIDVRILDHFIIGKGKPYSFAESGLL
ncbi:RadC family protein [Chitinimonas lacunae]|uniref:DNA repair protein RadC n=1 Tax=Chitinimonas lacunae TaxID=1963018 RepID=A0ABV8MV32_9NEIS